MIDDIEGDIQETPADTSPSSEPSSEPGETVSSDEVKAAVQAQRERGPDGKFRKASDHEGATLRSKEPGRDKGADKGISTGATQSSPESASIERGKSPDQGGHRPPPGFSVATKQAWESLPDHVKADIAKREGEIDAGMKRYSGLANFAEEAERNGTTLQNAVSDYVAVETEIRKDMVSGLEFLCRKLGANPIAVLKGWLSRYVPAQGNGQATQNPGPQYAPAQIDPNVIVAQATQAVRSEFQMRELNSQIEAFSANPANKFFPNVRQDMAILVQAGKAADLQTAYEAACWLHPEIRAILLEEMRSGNRGAARTAARAQTAAKAVTGAPASGQPSEPPRRRDLSLDEEIRAAINAQRGAA